MSSTTDRSPDFYENLSESLLNTGMPTSTANLNAARDNQHDEFYSDLRDIEAEIGRHAAAGAFNNKAVCLPCDKPTYSHFWHHFRRNFQAYGLTRLVASFHSDNPRAPAYSYMYDGVAEVLTPLQFNGDFRSPEVLKIIDSCDVVVTNPPFSIWREFFAAITAMQKEFCIMGALAALNYKEVRPHIASNHVRVGYGIKPKEFRVPRDYAGSEPVKRTDATGARYVQLRNVRWLTTFKVERQPLALTETYDPARYPAYDNYSRAVEVPKYTLIPHDYYDEMGVPLTFLEHHDDTQFDLVGFNRDMPKALFSTPGRDLVLNGRTKFARVIIKRKPQNGARKS